MSDQIFDDSGVNEDASEHDEQTSESAEVDAEVDHAAAEVRTDLADRWRNGALGVMTAAAVIGSTLPGAMPSDYSALSESPTQAQVVIEAAPPTLPTEATSDRPSFHELAAEAADALREDGENEEKINAEISLPHETYSSLELDSNPLDAPEPGVEAAPEGPAVGPAPE